jgi:hypothetical protein
MASTYFQAESKKKKKTQRKKMQRRERIYLSSLTSTFKMKWSSWLLLFTFLKPCVSCLLEALCYSSSGALPSIGDGVSGK